MKFNFEKEKAMTVIKGVFSYVLIAVALILGFTIGRYTQDYPPKETKSVNPYSTPLKPEEVSIAVDEQNNLLVIQRKTGDYIVYSNEIGVSIFKMYTNRIYQNVKD
jgi:hypothetical protein